jgi:hypothetical protein
MKTGGEHMLQEPAEELRGVKRENFPGTRIALTILEGRAPVLFLEDALGRERGAVHIPGEVTQRFLTGANGFGVDDPFLLPDTRRHLRQEFVPGLQGSTEESAHPPVEHFFGQKELRVFKPDPTQLVRREKATRHDVMNVRMEDKLA